MPLSPPSPQVRHCKMCPRCLSRGMRYVCACRSFTVRLRISEVEGFHSVERGTHHFQMTRRRQRGLQVPEHLQNILAGQRLVAVQQVHRLVLESCHRAIAATAGRDFPIGGFPLRTNTTVFGHTTGTYAKTSVQRSYTAHRTLRAQPVCVLLLRLPDHDRRRRRRRRRSRRFPSLRAPLFSIRPRTRCDDHDVSREFKTHMKIVELNV